MGRNDASPEESVGPGWCRGHPCRCDLLNALSRQVSKSIGERPAHSSIGRQLDAAAGPLRRQHVDLDGRECANPVSSPSKELTCRVERERPDALPKRSWVPLAERH